MRLARWLDVPLGIDASSVAGLFGALAGAGSLVEPYWTGLAEALLAIVGLGAVARLSLGRGELRPGAMALAMAVAAAVAAWTLPGAWAVGRGAVLGAGAAASAHFGRRLRSGIGGVG